MCASPNANTISDLTNHVLVISISTFKEENDLPNLSFSLDELFAGYLDSDVSEYDESTRLDRFRDYLKIKELLQIIQ